MEPSQPYTSLTTLLLAAFTQHVRPATEHIHTTRTAQKLPPLPLEAVNTAVLSSLPHLLRRLDQARSTAQVESPISNPPRDAVRATLLDLSIAIRSAYGTHFLVELGLTPPVPLQVTELLHYAQNVLEALEDPAQPPPRQAWNIPNLDAAAAQLEAQLNALNAIHTPHNGVPDNQLELAFRAWLAEIWLACDHARMVLHYNDQHDLAAHILPSANQLINIKHPAEYGNLGIGQGESIG
ncbi:MAG: hypothetical protein AAFS10_25280 [Myxococcota bacterium]